MKHFWAGLLLGAALLAPCAASAQVITMENARLAFDYPDSWLVVSPQLAHVYAPILSDAGIDGDALSEELAAAGVHSRAYSEDYTEHMSVLTKSDDLSEDVFDIAHVTDSQRKTIKTRAENGQLFETTGYRVQDIEWQKVNGQYWLYIHYTRTFGDQLTGRGLRYISVKNGMYVMLDWQVSGRRFTNKDLASFKARLSDLVVTETMAEPVRTVRLTAQIPTETSISDLVIEGTSEAGATLIVETPNAAGAMHTLCVGEAGKNGKFSLTVPLEEEGSYDLVLTASVEGKNDATASGHVTYSAKTLPVSLSGAAEGESTIVTSDSVKISGQTLAGVQMQLVSPFGMTKKRAGNDGTFSFELTTKDEGEYQYTLICDKDGYDQRRIRFTLVREMTDDQARAQVKSDAQKISYKDLQKDLAENRGKTLVIYGPVSEVSSSGANYYVRMYYNRAGGSDWKDPVIIVANADLGVKAGDMLTAAVTVAGVYEEQDQNGDPVMVPRFDLQFVDKIE